MKRFAIALIAVILLSITAFGQGVSINETGDPANDAAMLDVSSIEKGVLIPRLTLVQRGNISSPVLGLLIYQTDNTPGFYYYDGGNWKLVGSGALGIDDLRDGAVTSGSVYLGQAAGLVDDGSNNYNVGIGYNALRNNNSGFFNSATGYQSLFTNTSGTHNTANGYQSFYSSTLGINNTGMGFRSAYQNTNGSNNTCIGYNANFYNQTGSGNTVIGSMAGMGTAVHNKTGNVFLGYSAGFYETGSNKLYIENSDISTPLIYGEFDNDLLRVNGTLDINNAYQLPTADGSNGQVLKTNGSGSLTWSNDTGASDINGLSDGRTGGHSVFLGLGAGLVDDGIDNCNVGLGENSLRYNTLGYFNTAVGYRSLYNNVGGTHNVANGYQALYANSGGIHNTALGFQSSRYNSIGNYNTCIGFNANFYNEEGSRNTIIGYQAGMGTTQHNKTGNVFLGNEAGFNETGSNRLYIENSNSASPLIYGEFDNDLLRVNGTLDINNEYQLPTTDGNNNQVLKSNGSGVLSWANDMGALIINDLLDGKTTGLSVYLGALAGANDDGQDRKNVSVGVGSLNANESGSFNVAAGHEALNNSTTSRNTAIGYQSLSNTNSGESNTGVGYRSGYQNTGGSNNTLLGYQANTYNQTGSNNTIIGHQAGQGTALHNKSGNVFLGYQAGYDETGSNKLYIENSNSTTPLIYGEFDNDLVRVNGTLDINNAFQFPTADGNAGQILGTDGSGNLSWGDNDINSLADGKTIGSSVYLGTNAGNDDAGTLHYNCGLGHYALEEVTSGYYNTAMGAISLGDLTAGDGNTTLGYMAGANLTTGSNNTFLGYLAGDSETYTGLENTSALGYNTQPTSNNTIHIGNTSVTWIGGQVTWSTYSDERMKENIREDVKGLDFIMKLRPVTYHVNKDNIDGIMGVLDKSDYPEKYDIEKITQSGFLAQEVEQAAIESGYDFSGIHAPVNEHTPYSISYSEFVVPLVKAMQEQQELIQELRQEIEELKAAARAE